MNNAISRVIIYIPLCMLCFLFTACHRQVLEEALFDTAKIPVSIDWTRCMINPQNVSVFFYHESSGLLAHEYYFENNTNTVQKYLRVPLGTYTVVVFNELPGDLKNVDIVNRENLTTLEAIAAEAKNISLQVDTEDYAAHPANLATVIVHHFAVTPELLNYTNSSSFNPEKPEAGNQAYALMNLIPLSRISNFKYVVYVKGLNNARMPALVNLKNMSNSYFFDDNKNGTIPVTYQTTTSDSIYNINSVNDGLIKGSFNLFGTLGNRYSTVAQIDNKAIIIEIMFMLVDAERTIIRHSFEVTDDIVFTTEESGMVILSLNLDDNEPLPDVNPEGGESGFGANLVNWDEVIVDLDAN